jgi:hypothetical protein
MYQGRARRRSRWRRGRYPSGIPEREIVKASEVFAAERHRRRQIQAASAHRIIDYGCLAWAGVAVATGGDPVPVLLIWIGSSVAAIRRSVSKRDIEP